MELQDFAKSKYKSNYTRIPEVEVPSMISKILFTWMNPLLFTKKLKLGISDTFPLLDSEKVANENLSKNLEKHRLFYSIIRSNICILSLTLFLDTISMLLEFTSPIYMQLLLEYLSSEDKPLTYGFLLLISFTLISLCYPFIESRGNFLNDVTKIRIRNSLYNTIYNKTLISANLPEGLGINLLQVDVNNIEEFFEFLPYVINTPLEIFIATYIIYNQVGSSVFAAMGTIFIVMIANLLLSSTCKRLNDSLMQIRDERIEISTQLLTEMKMIKAYNWGSYFYTRINNIRKKELSKLKHLNVLNSINEFSFWILPSISFLTLILYYTLVLNQDISYEKLFVTLVSIYYLTFPLLHIPETFMHVIQLIVSTKRIEDLIRSKPWVKLNDSGKISLKKCYFGYEGKDVLKDISIDISDNEFLAVIGPVGSGKSSFLMSLIGEINLKSGNMKVNTDIAYAPSLDPWILNNTIRENILMGRVFVEEWYWKVLDACCLNQDLETLPAGDSTEIGERGINLSGGQKARICLARAVYSDKQVILLDDPLSSVDSRVAEHIFNKCFTQLLKNKTRILVTNRYSYLSNVDRILQLKDGEIFNLSSPENIKIQEHPQEDAKNIDPSPGNEDIDQDGRIIQEEDREVGEVSREIYQRYIQLSGAYCLLPIGILCTGLWAVNELLGDVVLKNWSDNLDETRLYLTVFIVMKIFDCVLIFIRIMLFQVIISIRGSYNSHQKLIASLILAPINLFYDVTPSGRVLNRLSKDMKSIDEEVSKSWESCIANVWMCLGCIGISVLYFPQLVIIIPLIFFLGKHIGKVYLKSSRELTRLESISRSPMLNHFKETLSGVKFVRVFDQTDNFIQKNQEKIDANTRINYSLSGSQQWMRLYLSLLSSLLKIGLYFLAILFRDTISAGIVGLCMTYLMYLPQILNDTIIELTKLENLMISVERVTSYTQIAPEMPLSTEKDDQSPNWPIEPSIKFIDVQMRYRPNTEIILKGISLDIPAGFRIGLAGRTGSGKSSIFLSLLRIVELYSGCIIIDDVNIALLGLKKLRENITLIPQDPLIFNGTVKENLDPLNKLDSSRVASVLHDIGLKLGLDHPINNSGKNISVGERQLLSLSRALLTNTKILLFDEATAGIDPDTDLKIQEIIKSKFLGCTILTIAHRLETIQNSDLVMVLDEGKVIEYDTPQNLLSSNTKFRLFSEQLK